MSTFYEKLTGIRAAKKSVLCVGLDPDPEKIPEGYGPDELHLFLEDIIRATADYAIAYKPNLAFFEPLGPKGLEIFAHTVKKIHEHGKGAIVIADAKRGDLGNSASFYAKAFFETYGCDAITVNPYMGFDSVEPFASSEDRGCFILCLTSNPGAIHFEMHGHPPLYQLVAERARVLSQNHQNIGLVVGATRDPALIRRIRGIAPEMPFLIPGVGTQGGDLRAVLEVSGENSLVNASRSIIFAAKRREEVMSTASDEARSLVTQMREILYGKG
jgi:orotidine-5'-phosphate decarboxylase